MRGMRLASAINAASSLSLSLFRKGGGKGGIKENIKLAKGLECDMYKRTNPLIMTLPFVNPCNLPTLVELPFRSSFHPSTVTFNPS
jgi:hypothetical protein